MTSDRPDPTQPSLKALERCLLHIAAELGRPLTPSRVFAAQHNPDKGLNVKETLALAQDTGLQAGFGARRLEDFDDVLAPAVLLMQGDKAVVYHGRGHGGDLLIFDPELDNGIAEMPEGKVAALYSGYAILFRKAYKDGPKPETGKDGHWFWSALMANRWSYAQVALAAAMTNFLGLATSVFIMVVYDRVLPNEATESLVALTVGVGLALLFDFILKILRAGFIDRAGQKADMLMGRRIFNQILNIRMQSRPGSIGAMASTVREFETLREFFTSATLVAVVDLPFIALFIFAIYMVGGQLAAIPALAVPVVLLAGLVVQPFLSRLAARNFDEGQSKQSVLVETLAGLETIKTTTASNRMRKRWEEAVERHSQNGIKSRAITQFALNLTGFVQQAAQVLIVFYGVFLIADGHASMGALVASVMLTGRALAPLGQVAQTLTRVNQARSAYRNLQSLMSADCEQPAGRTWISRPSFSGRVSFKDVCFAYPGQEEATLRNVTFTIEPGEKVAILGQIGSGKSTIARLLLGLYQPRSGSVLLDNIDIRQIDPGDLRRSIGSVLQDIWLFSGSVRDNIVSGAYRPEEEDLIRAGRIAGVEDFVNRHPSGYDLQLAERGEGLSGGQRQAIALARALIGRPPVLILDEPTSAMDVKTEAEIIQRLKTATDRTTTIVVTHRTSLLEMVDRVIVIENGRIAADGPKSILTQRAHNTRRHLNVAAS